MKITPDHYAILRAAIVDAAESQPNASLLRYKFAGQTVTRWGWDMLWLAQSRSVLPQGFLNGVIYRHYNDSHVDTAIRKIASSLDEYEN